MKWKLFGSTGAALALAFTPAPLIAQDAEDEAAEAAMEAAFAGLAEAFVVEPLTAEQEARLPLARDIVEKVIPEGALMEVMGGMFDGMLGPLADLAADDTGTALVGSLGYSANDLGIDDEAAEQVLAIIDPGWRERNRVESEMGRTMMEQMMGRMEPMVRDVTAELYAIYFDEQQLADINAFFATPSGAAYARESYRMTSDPRLGAAIFSDPELFWGPMMEMGGELEAAMAALPARRTLADLSKAEINRLIALTGLAREDLELAIGDGSYVEEAF